MTLILKSDNTKNGISLKENARKFEEATSTSGCDLEMSEITSSMPNSFSLKTIESGKKSISNANTIEVADIVEETVRYRKVIDENAFDMEDVIDGFSVFSFETEEDLIKFSVKDEKIDTQMELEHVKSKKMSKSKKQNKLNKVIKDSQFNDDANDIYDFQVNGESSPSSKDSSVNFKKLFNKKFATKYIKRFRNSSNPESTLSPSEGNSSSTSVTEFRNNCLTVESPRPTSNEDNNVVSTTTPDNVNIELEKLDLMKSSEKIQTVNVVVSHLKTASVRLYKFEDELTMASRGIDHSTVTENQSEINLSESVHSETCNNSDAIEILDEKCLEKAIPNTFSVDLLTKISETQTLCDKISNIIDFDTNTSKGSPGADSSSSAPISVNNCRNFTSVVTDESAQTFNNKMTSAVVKTVIGTSCCSSGAFRDGFNHHSCKNNRAMTNYDESNDDDNNNNNNNNHNGSNKSSAVTSPMQSWLELHNKGLIHQQQLQQQQQQQQQQNIVQTISNSAIMPTKTASSNSLSGQNSTSHSSHCTSNNNNISVDKSQHESSHHDWKNPYFDNQKLISNSVQKCNQVFSSLSHELVNNIRYQQEQQELMNVLRLKHENSKIPKPLVHMGLESMYKVDHSLHKNPESRFQAPNMQNYFMSNSQLPSEFNTANVFKNRSDLRCSQNSMDSAQNKDSFSKAPTSNFKTPETIKRRGQWCDMHVKIAYYIYRSQKRISLLKTQELNSQISHLMYSQKLPPNTPAPTASAYTSGFLQHTRPYLDYRSSQLKPDPSYINYQSKSSSAFLNPSSRPHNPYHSIIPQNIEAEFLPPNNPYDDHHQSPEQKWFRLLNNYMAGNSVAPVDRPSPEILNQLYSWYQQIAQNNNNSAMPHFSHQGPPAAPLQASNIDPNMVYLRKYMEHLSSCLGSMKGSDSGGYLNNAVNERDMQLYLMKQQQYQKALLSKYQSSASNKPSNMSHLNPLLLNSSNSYYNKKLDPMLQQYPLDPLQSLVNQKYRLTQDQIRQISHHQHHQQSRNGFTKLSELSHPKRRKMNPDCPKNDLTQIVDVSEKTEPKIVTDLTGDYGPVITMENSEINLVDNVPLKSRENLNYHLQTMIPDNKE